MHVPTAKCSSRTSAYLRKNETSLRREIGHCMLRLMFTQIKADYELLKSTKGKDDLLEDVYSLDASYKEAIPQQVPRKFCLEEESARDLAAQQQVYDKMEAFHRAMEIQGRDRVKLLHENSIGQLLK